MCDTIIATGEVTDSGFTLFGKNSDREPNEAHHLTRIPALDHTEGSNLSCTYITIPQVAHTHEVLLAKPFWMWGAEMGANEHGLVIGNEAVFTRMPYRSDPALLGMDLLRLGLERATTAREAVDVITGLLELHGQGGNCGYKLKFNYHNSYLLADPQQAWLLETADNQWAAMQVRGVYSISNGLTITDHFDLSSTNLISTAIEKGWCKSESDFSFRDCYSDRLYSRLASCQYRRGRTTSRLHERSKLEIADVMSTLRDHGDTPDPRTGITRSNVCMHAGTGRLRRSQTTGSMVSCLAPQRPTHFVTGTAAPCTSFFKPIWTDNKLPDLGSVPEGVFDPKTLFWRHEQLHRSLLKNLPDQLPELIRVQQVFEEEMIQEAMASMDSTSTARSSLTGKYFRRAAELEDQLTRSLVTDTVSGPLLYRRRWRRINSEALIPVS
jgi:secernin